MPTPSGVTLRQLLPDSLDALESKVTETLREQPPATGTRLAWGFVAKNATREIHRALDVDVFKVLAGVWCATRELKKYKDPVEYPPGKTMLVHLGDHKLPPFAIHPELQVKLGVVPVLTLRFTLELTAHFRSIALAICDGHIVGVGSGDGAVSAQLKYGDIKLHPPFESQRVTPEMSFDFKAPGLAIG